MVKEEASGVPYANELQAARERTDQRIVVLHERAGIRGFDSVAEAALFLLVTEQIPLSKFREYVETEKTRIVQNPAQYGESELWKYHLLKDTSIGEAATPVAPSQPQTPPSTPPTADPADEAPPSKRSRRGRPAGRTVQWSNGVDITLAASMHIPLDQEGALVRFSEVKRWVNPSPGDLDNLRRRVVREWMQPLQLRQQDIVKATGVGAPYICYLFKDPENPNMTQRRRIEAYSVLSELFEKYDKHVITDDDFLSLKNSRIQSRYLKRQSEAKKEALPSPKIEADWTPP